MFMKGPVTAGADCKTNWLKSNPAILDGHVKMILAPDGVIARRGVNERLKTVPLPEAPPELVVPYKALPDNTNPPDGCAPSLLVCGAG